MSRFVATVVVTYQVEVEAAGAFSVPAKVLDGLNLREPETTHISNIRAVEESP